MYDAVAQSTLTMAIGARVGGAHVTLSNARAQAETAVVEIRTSP